MKITKYVHSCLLVETPDRTALFDPGMMSQQAVEAATLTKLDDIFITHSHGDHLCLPLVQALVAKFPNVRITSTAEVVKQLSEQGIKATTEMPAGAVVFESPHESTAPLFPRPEEIGVHYLDSFSHPGDSHSFRETKAILALPVQAPWGSPVAAVNAALALKPKHVLPIHDWHWSNTAREQMYDILEAAFAEYGITFHKLQTGQPITIEI